MDAFAGYGSDDDSDNGAKDEDLALAAASTESSFKPAWENHDDDNDESDNDEIDDKAKQLASSNHVSSAAHPSKSAAVSTTGSEPAVKKKKLPSALDALNTATTTFLAAQQPEPDGEESAARAGAVVDVALASGTANTTQQANDSRLKTPSSAPSLGGGMTAGAGERAAAEKAAKDKAKSFSAKEKRKRDIGQSSRGKNYVEEEKRILREHGSY